MRKFYFSICLFCSLFTMAQNGFEEQVIIDPSFSVNNPEQIITADIDGDNDQDVISISLNDNKVSWFENLDGLGSFSILKEISTSSSNPSHVSAEDIDGDNDLDIIVSSYGSNEIVWFENTDGLGNFGEKQVIVENIDGFNLSHAVADIDGDNDLDIVATSESTVVWFQNLDGMANFNSAVVLDNSSYSSFVVAEDINGDGNTDVIFAHSNSELRWLDNVNGDATSWIPTDIDTLADGIIEIAVEDVDNSNGKDVVITSSINNKLFWIQNDGSMNYDNGQEIPTVDGYVQAVDVADLDNDTHLDIISVAGTIVSWYKNTDGSGNFAAGQVISNSISEGISALTADINGDGNLDVLSASSLDNKVAWYQNVDATGNFGDQKLLSFDVEGLTAITKSDLDGDGALDIVSASDRGKLSWYRYLGDNNFGVQRPIYEDFQDFSSVFSEDMDGDGDMDIITSSYFFNSITWFENLDGLGDFGSPNVVTTTLSGIRSVVALDVDNDGDNDIVSLSFFNNKLVWFENTNGQGSFGSELIIDANVENPQSIVIGDIDGDTDFDIIVNAKQRIQWYENLDGSNGLGPANAITTSISNNSNISVADVDGDNDIDVLSGSGNRIAWYENLNGSAFSAENLITDEINSVPKSVIASDLDLDGDMDIVSSQDQNLTWFENLDGNGSYGTEITISEDMGTAIHILASDFNSNNANDLVVLYAQANINFFKISWLKNKIVTNRILGNVSFGQDLNACSSNPIPVYNQLVSASSTEDSWATVTNNTGDFQINVYEGEFITELINVPNYFDYTPLVFDSSFSTVNNSDTLSFCLIPNSAANDLFVVAYPSENDPRPGFNTTYQIVYGNLGTSAVDGAVSFEFNDSKIQFLTASQAVSSQTTNSLQFDFTNLNPFETRSIELEFNVFPPPTTNIDDILVSTATVNPIAGDETEEDNIFELEQTVIGSYDPNDITCLQGDEILIEDANKYLNYLIRFQNTGTASAINVRVEHVLDDRLDWTTIQLESLSHSGRLEIANGNQVNFIFDNINLPDIFSDEAGSNGYIAFKIKPMQSVEVGDVISGVADIYFDFNPPITTNTATTEIVEPLSVDEFNSNSVLVYPNPADATLNITSAKVFNAIIVYDFNGRILLSRTTNTSTYQLDISELNSGIYFVEIHEKDKKTIEKVIIK